MELTRYKEYVRKRILPLELQPSASSDKVKNTVEAAAEAYGYLAGINTMALERADKAAADRVLLAMDSIVEAIAWMGIDVRDYKIK